jgi:radical SAM superfamily enzyme YgiQ (UPF0313 family)
MNILFVYSLYEINSISKPLRSQEQIHFGISYISALLKQDGHRTKLIVLSRTNGENNNNNIINESVRTFKPRIVCFTSVSSEYGFVAGLANYIKSNYNDIYLIIGGVHATLNPEAVIKDSFDAVCIGEGEYPMLELVNEIEAGNLPMKIQNFWFKNKDIVNKNGCRPFIQNLDDLPFLDRDIWQEWIDERYDSQHAIILGRGCPFDCSYCSNHAVRKTASGSYVRLRNIDSIIEELKIIYDTFPNNRNIYLEIETFFINKKWSLELCGKLKDLNKTLPMPLNFGVNLRVTPNTDYGELFAACKESNFRFINIGLESGSERVRRDVLMRNYSNQDIINTVKAARCNSLKVAFYNLIGLPEETLEDYNETLEINRICQPDWIMTSIFFPYPGTDLYNLCKTKGYLNVAVDTEMERSKSILNLPGFTKKQIQKAYEWFYFDVYKGKKPMLFLFLRVFVMKIRKWPKIFQIYLKASRSEAYSSFKSSFKKRFNKVATKIWCTN